jgi:fatty acid desaturase
MGRIFWQFVGVLLLIRFVGAYFWWIAAIAAVAALVWIARHAFRSIDAIEAEDAQRAQAEARRRAAVARRADQQHQWALAGDDRGVYGTYPPANLA